MNDLGNLLVLSGRVQEAEDAYRRALQMGQDDHSIRLNLGLLLQQIGEDKKAIKEFEHITKAEPNNPWPYYQMGMSWEAVGAERKAVKNYVKAFSLDSRLTDPLYNPQVIQSNLSTQSLVSAYLQDPMSSLAPRSYSQPSLIRDLIVPQFEQAERRAAQSEAEPTAPDAATLGRELAVEAPALEPEPLVKERPTRRKPRPRKPDAAVPQADRDTGSGSDMQDLAAALRNAAEKNDEKDEEDPDG